MVFKDRSTMTEKSVDPVNYQDTKGTLKKGEITAEKISESFHQCSVWRRSERFTTSQGMRWRSYSKRRKVSIEEVLAQINKSSSSNCQD